jgi:predicted nucleotidyltransferase
MAMLQKLFSSKVRVALLHAFFLHPDQPHYLRELERMTGEDYKNISSELKNLEAIGLLSSTRSGNLKYFHLNRQFLLYDELKSIFFKIGGSAGLLKRVLTETKGIEYAFIYGSYAAGTENSKSDIDLMIIGKASLNRLLTLIREPEQKLGRDINVSLYGLSETRTRIKDHDPFMSNVMSEPKIMLIGNEDDLRRLAP